MAVGEMILELARQKGGDEGEKDWDGTWKWLVVSFVLLMLLEEGGDEGDGGTRGNGDDALYKNI